MMSDDSMPEISVCVRLRAERERRQIPLSSISANTKISASLLAALERGDLSRWPTGIFRRSFVRTYAAAVGLDPDEIAREFFAEFPEPLDSSTNAASPNARAANPAHPSADNGGLRLKLADAPTPFIAGPLLYGMRQRWAAMACDAGVVAVVALCVFIATDNFWMPLAVAMAGYYLGGILLLGNTPGVCLLAPGEPTKSPYNPSDGVREPDDERQAAHSDWHLRVPAR
jgi:hypothetical protein